MENNTKPVSDEEFQEILNDRLEQIRVVLGEKALEYVRNDDRLHNFNRAAQIENCTREKAIWGMALKHYVSFQDMLDDIDRGILPSEELVDEKIGDLINYLILTEASIKNRINNRERKVNESD